MNCMYFFHIYKIYFLHKKKSSKLLLCSARFCRNSHFDRWCSNFAKAIQTMAVIFSLKLGKSFHANARSNSVSSCLWSANATLARVVSELHHWSKASVTFRMRFLYLILSCEYFCIWKQIRTESIRNKE